MQKVDERLHWRLKIITLAHDQIERLPNDGYEIKAGGICDATRRDSRIGASGTNGLRNIGTGLACRSNCRELIE